MPSRSSIERRAHDLIAMVKRAVNAADPEGLLAGGAPDDEYEREVALIAGRIYNRHASSVEAIHAIVYEAFGPHADGEAHTDTFRQLAESLMRVVNELGLHDA